MKLIKPSYSIIHQESGLEGIYKNIELAARNCYKSEPVEGVTPEAFVERMIKLGHLSTLEHGTVYLKFYGPWDVTSCCEVEKYKNNPYSKVVGPIYDRDDYKQGERQYSTAYITSNLRVLLENGWMEDLQNSTTYNKCYLCEPTEFHEKRVTVKFTSNIHFYKDITRHRPFSFCIESSRYNNYSKGKFGSELTFIIPVWMDKIEEYEKYYGIPGSDGIVRLPEGSEFYQYYTFLWALLDSEDSYMELIYKGWTAQQAAEVLPQATKADIIMTGFVSDWKHVFDLRTSIIAKTGQPHPEIARLMDPLYEEFKERGLIV